MTSVLKNGIRRFRFTAVAILCIALAILVVFASPAHAQSTSNVRWVASTGSDSNPCTRQEPCATFQGALSKTPSGGEVHVVDAADYGPVNVTFPVTIDGGNLATLDPLDRAASARTSRFV